MRRKENRNEGRNLKVWYRESRQRGWEQAERVGAGREGGSREGEERRIEGREENRAEIEEGEKGNLGGKSELKCLKRI